VDFNNVINDAVEDIKGIVVSVIVPSTEEERLISDSWYVGFP
jgi:hypothetical protein